jgi:hypothetical protein
MNVYNRPLFRQAGGPAQMMPQDMAQQGMPPQGMAPQGMPPQGGSGVDPQMEQALTAAEQQSAAGMAEVGASYAENMMSGLDNAEDYKTVIDSIRGNALPMEARYSELASLVGEEDARKTPESVLTLIQPTIMMTEQGAMDSGIGELMRQVTGEIDMETENGMPTEMGQGVGSLMTAGVGQQPTQNFSLGGPVVRMGTGGNPRLEQLSSEILGNYRNIMGDGEDQKKLTQAQILFDIADAAGRFASGTNAQGQSVAGLSPFAQLGAATSGLGSRIGERVGELDKQDRALKLSALGAAQTEYSAEQAAARAAAKDTFSLTTLYGADGKPVTINTGNAEGRARATEMVDVEGFTTVAPKEKKFEAVMFYLNNEDGTVEQKMVNVGTANGIDMAETLAARGFVTDNAAASALLQERFTLKAEGRAEDRLIKAEARAADATLSKEERGNAEFDRRAAEAELSAIRAEGRANDTALSDEARAQARADVERSKDLMEIIGAERRANNTTISAEERAQARADVERAKDLLEKKDAEKRALETAPIGKIPRKIFDAFDAATQKRILLGDPEGVKNIPLDIWESLSPEDQKAVLGTEDKSSFGNSLEGLQLAMLTDETMINKFQSGKLTAAEETLFVGALENYIAPKRDQFGTSISNPLPARIIQALRARQDAGLPVSENIDPALYMPKSEAAALEAIRLIPLDIDITMATGPLGVIQAGLESTLSGASEILPFLPSTSGSVIGGAEALKAKKAVSALAQATERFYTEGRILATEFANIQKELVRPDQVTNDAEALAAFEKQKSLLLQAQQRGNNILANPKSFSEEELRGARQDLAAITQLLPDYNEAIRQYSNKVNGTTTGKQNPANFDRRKGQGFGPTVIDGYTIEAIQ